MKYIAETKHKYFVVHLVALYDLRSHKYVDIEIQPARLQNEHEAICLLCKGQTVKNIIFQKASNIRRKPSTKLIFTLNPVSFSVFAQSKQVSGKLMPEKGTVPKRKSRLGATVSLISKRNSFKL